MTKEEQIVKEVRINALISSGKAVNEEEAEELYKKQKRHEFWLKIKNNKGLYLMFIPVAIFVILLYYWPMLGIRYAFYEYRVVGEPTFVGFANFVKLFKNNDFWTSFGNTLVLSIMKLLLTTLFSVVISVFINEMANAFWKKTFQTIIYLPHFMSWAVVAAIFSLILSPSATGMVNGILRDVGILEATESIYFLAEKSWWRPLFYIINIWKETGWGTVIFLATLSGINPDLYEAAEIDGATRLQRMWYITIPALSQTVFIVLILNLAKVLNMFESVFVLYNNAVMDVSDVISTYIYRQTFQSSLPNYGYTIAAGLFKSLVGAGLVLLCNWASKKIRGRGIL